MVKDAEFDLLTLSQQTYKGKPYKGEASIEFVP